METAANVHNPWLQGLSSVDGTSGKDVYANCDFNGNVCSILYFPNVRHLEDHLESPDTNEMYITISFLGMAFTLVPSSTKPRLASHEYEKTYCQQGARPNAVGFTLEYSTIQYCIVLYRNYSTISTVHFSNRNQITLLTLAETCPASVKRGLYTSGY